MTLNLLPTVLVAGSLALPWACTKGVDSNLGDDANLPEPGQYTPAVSESDWINDTCGVTEHVIVGGELRSVVTTSGTEIHLQFGSAAVESGAFTLPVVAEDVEHGLDCTITITTSITGQVIYVEGGYQIMGM